MPTGTHVRIIASGQYTTGLFAGEIFQTGISVTQSDGGGDFPGGIKVTPTGFTADFAATTDSTALFNVDRAWVGTSKFDVTDQNALSQSMHAFLDSTKSLMYNTQRWTEIRMQAFTADGKVINGATVYTYKVPVQGSAALGSMPAQLAGVMSLRSGARGPSGRGRMYLPFPGLNASGGGLSSSGQTTILAAGKALCESLWHDAQAVPCIWSQAHGYYSGISSIAVGNLWDTQRRRTQAAVETYQNATPAY